MHFDAILLACLTCACNARRVQTGINPNPIGTFQPRTAFSASGGPLIAAQEPLSPLPNAIPSTGTKSKEFDFQAAAGTTIVASGSSLATDSRLSPQAAKGPTPIGNIVSAPPFFMGSAFEPKVVSSASSARTQIIADEVSEWANATQDITKVQADGGADVKTAPGSDVVDSGFVEDAAFAINGEKDWPAFADEDLSADGPIAQQIRAELAALIALPDETFRIADTGDARGLGLYAAEFVAAGMYLFDYGGATLEQSIYDERYPIGGARRADYAVGLVRADGSSVYLDDAMVDESSTLARYMNHAGVDPSVSAWTLAEPSPRVLFFAARDLAKGDELVWDYGDEYWAGRTDLVAE